MRHAGSSLWYISHVWVFTYIYDKQPHFVRLGMSSKIFDRMLCFNNNCSLKQLVITMNEALHNYVVKAKVSKPWNRNDLLLLGKDFSNYLM